MTGLNTILNAVVEGENTMMNVNLLGANNNTILGGNTMDVNSKLKGLVEVVEADLANVTGLNKSEVISLAKKYNVELGSARRTKLVAALVNYREVTVAGFKAQIRSNKVAKYNNKLAKSAKRLAEIKAAADKRAKKNAKVQYVPQIVSRIAELNAEIAAVQAARTEQAVEDIKSNKIVVFNAVGATRRNAVISAKIAQVVDLSAELNIVSTSGDLELIAAVTEAKEKAQAELAELNNMEFNDEYVTRTVLRTSDIRALVKAGASTELVNELINELGIQKPTFNNIKDAKAIKKESKDLQVIFQRQIELLPCSYKKAMEGKFKAAARIVASQESTLLRAVNCANIKFADANFAGVRYGTEEIISLKISKSITGHDFSEKMLDKIFDRLDSTFNEGIYVLVEPNGTCTVSWFPARKETLDKGTRCLRYKLLNISASGMRSGSMTCALVATYSLDHTGKVVCTQCDRREELLDAAIDGAYNLNFKEYNDETKKMEFKKMTEANIFKALNRIANGNAPSKATFEIKNALIFNNIAEMAMFSLVQNVESIHTAEVLSLFKELKALNEDLKSYNGDNNHVAEINKIERRIQAANNRLTELNVYSAKDTKDGNIIVATECKVEYLNENNVPVHVSSVVGTTEQNRAFTMKSSMTYMMKKSIASLAKYMLEIGCELDYVIFKGKRVAIENVTEEMLTKIISNIDVLGDRNAVKLDYHNDNCKMVVLKTAYESDTKMTQILNLAMAYCDIDTTKSLLETKMMELLADAFSKVGLTYTLENGVPTTAVFDLEAKKRMNNSTQINEYLFNSDPAKTLAAFPYAVRHILANEIQSIANRLTSLDLPTDARYTVIQADPAVLYGVAILNNNEVYAGDMDIAVAECAAIRQPMSGPFAVSTFTIISLADIIKRIMATDLDMDKKEWIIDFYRNVKGYNVIPANHYLMEKHDGMDFDIDAMMFYYEKEVVEIAKQIKEQGVVLLRSAADHIKTDGDLAFEAFINDETVGVVRPKKVKAAAEVAEVKAEKVSESKLKSMAKAINKLGDLAAATNKEVNDSKTLMEVTPASISKVLRKFFKNPIADVGTITTGLYNNVATLISLNGDDTEVINKIVEALKDYYGISGDANKGIAYESPIKETTNEFGFTEYNVSKETCVEMLYRFSACEGSLADAKAFILDCCIANRYPGESSIDTVKNGYMIMDYFNHRQAIACLGIDKHMNFIAIPFSSIPVNELQGVSSKSNLGECEEPASIMATKLYNESRDLLGMDERSSFLRLPMIKEHTKIKEDSIAILDPIAQLKLDLAQVANGMIVLGELEIEKFVLSDEAKAIRDAIKTDFHNADLESKVDAKVVISSIETAYKRLSTSVTNEDTKNMEHSELVAKEFIENIGVAGVRNFAEISFGKLAPAEIGLIIANYYVNKLEDTLAQDGQVTTINPGLIKVMESEFLQGLEVLGFENVGTVAEEIFSVVADGKFTKVSALEDAENVSIDGAHGVTTHNGVEYIISTVNKKADITGDVMQIDDSNKYYIVADKTTKVEETEDLIIAVNQFNDVHVKDTIAVATKFSFVKQIEGTKFYNVLFADMADGTQVPVCTLVANHKAKAFLEKASDMGLLTKDAMSILAKSETDEYGNVFEGADVDKNEAGCIFFSGLFAKLDEVNAFKVEKKTAAKAPVVNAKPVLTATTTVTQTPATTPVVNASGVPVAKGVKKATPKTNRKAVDLDALLGGISEGATIGSKAAQ